MSEINHNKYTILFDLLSYSELLEPHTQGYTRSLIDKETDITLINPDSFVRDIIRTEDLFYDKVVSESSDTDNFFNNMTDYKDLYLQYTLDESKKPDKDDSLDYRFSKIDFLMFSGSNRNELISKTLGLGVIRLFIKQDEKFPDYDNESSSGDGTVMAILAVPSYFSTPDLFGFIGDESRKKVKHFRIFRSENPSRYMVLMKFETREDAVEFQKNNNGREFSSLETELCQVINVEKIMFRQSRLTLPGSTTPVSTGNGYPSSSKEEIPTSLLELPTCPVCLERMDASVTGLITRSCLHTFHCSCLWKWKGGNCPVCRSSSLESKKRGNGQRRCGVCSTTNNLWLCLICGNIACGRYDSGHAVHHFKSTNHCYAIDLINQSVWDYAEDRYVHRLIRNEADGKVVELPSKDDKSRKNNNNNTNDEIGQTSGKNENELLITLLLNIIQNTNKDYSEVKDEHTLKEVELWDRIELLERLNREKVSKEDFESLQSKHREELGEWQASMAEMKGFVKTLDEKLKLSNLDIEKAKAYGDRLEKELDLKKEIISQLELNLKNMETSQRKTEKKLKDVQAKLESCQKELLEEKGFSGALSEKLELAQKLQDSQKEVKSTTSEEVKELKKKIQDREEENRDLMFYIETLQKCAADPELLNADIQIQQGSSSTDTGTSTAKRSKNRRRLL